MNGFYVKLVVVALICLSVFGLLWKKGYLQRLTEYVGHTRDEMKKCNWPTRDELGQSTVLIIVVIGCLGIFTLVADAIILWIIRFLISA